MGHWKVQQIVLTKTAYYKDKNFNLVNLIEWGNSRDNQLASQVLIFIISTSQFVRSKGYYVLSLIYHANSIRLFQWGSSETTCTH